MTTKRYQYQQVHLNPLGDFYPLEIDPPAGYRLNSWRIHYGVGGISTQPPTYALVCWEREPVASQALAQLPHEWLTPLAEFVRRWVTKG